MSMKKGLYTPGVRHSLLGFWLRTSLASVEFHACIKKKHTIFKMNRVEIEKTK